MDKVYPQAVDFGFELWETVEQRLPRAPIILLQPVGGDFLCVGERQALCPVIDAFALRPAGFPETPLEVFELLIGRGNLKGCDLFTHGKASAQERLSSPFAHDALP